MHRIGSGTSLQTGEAGPSTLELHDKKRLTGVGWHNSLQFGACIVGFSLVHCFSTLDLKAPALQGR